MTRLKRTPSPDPTIEVIIAELQKQGIRCETVNNFNSVYPDAKRTSIKWR